MILEETTQVISQTQSIVSAFSGDVVSYIIFISMVFLLVFIILGWQLLNIFKSLLQRILEDVLRKLEKIEEEVKELKHRIN